MITKGERTELKSLIRQRFKVLRAEVEQRKAELGVELQAGIRQRFAADDKTWSDAIFLIEEAVQEANRKANDILRGIGFEAMDPAKDYEIVTARAIQKPTKERQQLQREGIARIEAQVKTAMLQLDRQEADLLTRLVTDALESDEAREFLGSIPTVGELVPADRLLALEQQLSDDAP